MYQTCSLYNKQKNTWMLGNTRFISRVEHDISHSFTALTREISCSTLEINLAFPHSCIILYLLYKVQCFIRISGTDKTDDLTCEIIYDNFTCENYCFSNNHLS